MDTVVDHYSRYVDLLRQQSNFRLDLPDRNLDTGNPTVSGKYRLTDFTYSKLLAQINKHPDTPIPASLRANIIAFYQSGENNYVNLKPKQWRQTQGNLRSLESAAPVELKTSDQPTKSSKPQPTLIAKQKRPANIPTDLLFLASPSYCAPTAEAELACGATATRSCVPRERLMSW